MPAGEIKIKGAREHNLRDVSLVLPRNQLICFTGVSGSGKSSLSFDTLYAEGQRRYVESLSSYARHFMGQLPKPDVDQISGLSPSISISQKSTGHNPRSTVGTITEVYDFLRVLYARVGTGHCPDCKCEITSQTREQILGRLQHRDEQIALAILAPLARNQKGEFKDLFEDLRRQGYARGRVDGSLIRLSEPPALDRLRKHNVEVVIDRFPPGPRQRGRLADAVDQAIKLGSGSILILEAPPGEDGSRDEAWDTATEQLISSQYACPECGLSFPAPSPQLFSFNSPQGMCPACDGLGHLYTFVPERLIPDPSLSLKQGAVSLLGPWSDLTTHQKFQLQGVAEALDKLHKLEPGASLSTAWSELPARLKKLWLWGTGNRDITFFWKNAGTKVEYKGKYEGLIPRLVSQYKQTKSKPQMRMYEKYMDTLECPDCFGKRLNPQASSVLLTTTHPSFASQPALSLPEFCELSIASAVEFVSDLKLSGTGQLIASEVLKEVRARLGFLMGVGLDYLTLARTAPTLSGGESQRIRLAGQIGSGLVGVLYILDEPSIGLHPRDNDRLIETLLKLRNAGNTLVVVEHDEDTMRAADLVVDFGPGPGIRGGRVVAAGTAEELAANPKSVTGRYLSGREEIAIPKQRRAAGPRWLTMRGARHNNLKNVDVPLPLGTLICITGVSGSGKSSLVGDILEPALRRDLNGALSEPGLFDGFDGLDQLDKMVAIDQTPIGRTPRSNPATYVKVFDEIRTLFTQLPEAKRRGYGPGRFSFNVEGGRCSACDGNGANRLEMDFLADVWVTCPLCEGRRYNRETLEVKFKDHSIADVLNLEVADALKLFDSIPKIAEALSTLQDVGLDYLKLGQPSPTLSGGEAQRIKLSRELSRKATGKTIYLLDEPTTGLHFADIRLLLKVLHDLVDRGNTVVIVEHNLDVIKTADWVIDLGPEGGKCGGEILYAGTPEGLMDHPTSHTGRSLARHLKYTPAHAKSEKGKSKKAAALAASKVAEPSVADPRGRLGSDTMVNGEFTHITIEGAQQHNLKSVDVRIPRDQMTVFCGPSGSGKTTLAMDTIYAEGQRRYVESMSAYARQFLGQVQKPKVDRVEGLSPAVALEQRNQGHSPRSTVGTVTEVYDYLRVLLARLGIMHCPACQVPVGTQTSDQVVDKILQMPEGSKILILAPVDFSMHDGPAPLWRRLRADGYQRVRVNGTTHSLDDVIEIDVKLRTTVQVVVDRAVVRTDQRSRIADSVEQALSIGSGVVQIALASEQIQEPDWRVVSHSLHLACSCCGRSFQPLTPHHFSFNTAVGWCPQCEGLGVQTGTNPAALLRDPKMTLAQGGLLLWPDIDQNLSRWMLRALARQADLPLHTPMDHLTASQRRLLFHGAGSRWFDVLAEDMQQIDQGFETPVNPLPDRQVLTASSPEQALFRFQFKGCYPAIEEVAKLSPALRLKLEKYVDEINCTTCDGSRLRIDAASVRLFERSVSDLVQMPLGQLLETIKSWKLDTRQRKIAGELIREVTRRVEFLVDVGLDYLTVGRGAASLSGGEAQRIRLAGQLGSGLCGVLYVLDEPTIGLHPRDNGRLLGALHKLRDLGNTLLVVEHDREIIDGSDHLCDFGPRAGRHGGRIVAQGSPAEVAKQQDSITGPFLSGKRYIEIPKDRRMTVAVGKDPVSPSGQWLTIHGARENNLRGIDVSIPLGAFVAVTGPSGSGKSSLIDDILYPALARRFHRAKLRLGKFDRIDGLNYIDKVIRVDQSPLGNSPTSNPATYSGVFDLIRLLFAQLPESKKRGYLARQFSFNVPAGRCEVCEGSGQRRIEMHFLPDVWVTCEECQGKRYLPDTLEVKFHGQSISDVLDMSIADCLNLFEAHPKIVRVLQTLADVGLEYLTLGQAAPTLSGGEAQRVKLAAELARPDTGRTLYLLDEPTTGLHFDDIIKLLKVMHRLVDIGNTVVVIEHNLDVIKQADWLIDLGPEAGAGGGHLVACGTPEQIVQHAVNASKATRSTKRRKTAANAADSPELLRSYTGEYLAPVLKAGNYEPREVYSRYKAMQETVELGKWTLFEELRINCEAMQQQAAKTADASRPWEALRATWHTKLKGFEKGETPRWNLEIPGQLLELLEELVGPDLLDFSDPKLVTVNSGEPPMLWARLLTKQAASVTLQLLKGNRTTVESLRQKAKIEGKVGKSIENQTQLSLEFSQLTKLTPEVLARLKTLLREHRAMADQAKWKV